MGRFFLYDKRNNLTKLIFNSGGRTFADRYYYSKNDNIANSESYAKDNLISRYQINSARWHDYTYDSLNRTTQVKISTDNPIYINYIYQLSARNAENQNTYRTTQIKQEIIKDTAYQYTYDVLGNITAIQKGTRTNAGTSGIDTTGYSAYRSYEYDNKSQLKRVNNASEYKTRTYEYDGLGNILSKTEYAYTASGTDVGTPTKTITYNYTKDNKTGWNYLLTGVDLDGDGVYNENGSESITYDQIGNPTTYLGATLTWYGRELQSYSDGTNSISYSYDVDGLRTSKSVTDSNDNTVKSEYYYEGGLLRHEKRGDINLYFRYDASGKLAAIHYYNAQGANYNYYVTTNFRGDVIGIYSATGALLASYEYDEWGKVLAVKDADGAPIENANHIANLNPIRYRGYYYDSETGLYYLQSRYYNPEIGRFLNADSQLNQQDGPLGFNMFAYCCNNPVNMSDPDGHWPESTRERNDNGTLGILGFIIAVYIAVYSFTSLAISTAGTLPRSTYSSKPKKSVSEAATKADTKIKDTVKTNSKDRYWKANRVGGIVFIGKPLSETEAINHVSIGKDVFTVTQIEAEALALTACASTQNILSPEINSGKENTPGYYYHYHPNPKNGSHVFYLFGE